MTCSGPIRQRGAPLSLDGINRYRFAREPQLLAAWDRAKHVVGGSQVEAPASTPEVPAAPRGPVTVK